MITFGAYVFPAGFRLASQQLDSKLDEIELLGLTGSHLPPGLQDSQTITIEGAVGGGEIGTAGDPLLSVELVKAELVTMAAALNGGYALLDLGDTPQRAIYCQKKSFALERVEGYGQRFATVKIAFVAPDPRFLSSTLHSITDSGNAANAGNAPTYPLVTIQGPAANPAVSVAPLALGGSVGVTVECGVSLGSSDILTIDCDPAARARAVVLNGVVRLDLLGTTGITNTIGDSALFPYLLPGNNGVGFAGLETGGSVLFEWPDAWTV